MIKIKFEKKDGFQNKPYLLAEGLENLAEIDAEFVENEQRSTIFIEIFDTKDKNFGYKGYFELGLGNGDSFFEWLETTLLAEFPENQEDIKEMLDRLAEEIAHQALSVKELPNKSIPQRKRSILLISGLIVFLLLVGDTGTYFLMNNQLLVTNAVETKDTFAEDLEQLEPKGLGEKYPDRLEEIAEAYKDQKNWENLEVFQELYPTAGGAFDLAFYKHDWDTVIQTEVTSLTEERKIMLCYAYLAKNMLAEAELLAKKLESSQLNEALDYAYLRKVGTLIKEKKITEAEEFGKKIQSDDLKKEYQEAVDSASLMKEMTDLYQKQKDSKNKEIWERRLNELGTVLEERGVIE